jgi:SAM-dependent methyltransferase
MTSAADDRALLKEQAAYYEARAAEYDRMLARSGSYHGMRRSLPRGGEAPDDDAGWERLVDVLRAFHPSGQVLEIACGTGAWTERLALTAGRVTAIDASPSMIEINRHRTAGRNVDHVVIDVFDWSPTQRYDAVFFAFWLTHVPPARFTPFFQLVRDCLEPDGRVLFFDETRLNASAAYERPLDAATGATLRTLEDGQSFRMVKVYYEPAALESRLHSLGWSIEVRPVSTRFFYGLGTRPAPPPGSA